MSKEIAVCKNRRSSRGSAQIAEFIPAIYVCLIMSLVPLLNLVAVFIGGTVQYLATNDLASKAATQAELAPPSGSNDLSAPNTQNLTPPV